MAQEVSRDKNQELPHWLVELCALCKKQRKSEHSQRSTGSLTFGEGGNTDRVSLSKLMTLRNLNYDQLVSLVSTVFKETGLYVHSSK